ncbi:hypothetical protein PENSPDRAFT_94981 [Peniophora sp. CONT]|nr:hypothetical protein PENSPDRAFT_94981 [Peniophora sp. CONT]
MLMPIKTPKALVLAFKKSGEFDRLRKQLLAQFQNSSAMETLTARVDDIPKRKFEEDERLTRKAPEDVHREQTGRSCRNWTDTLYWNEH